MKDVVILGAGITGLTTAFHLNKEGIDFLVLDKSDRVGGVINTVSENGYIYEEGPNSGVIGNVEVLRLFEDLKDECQLEIANDNVKKRYILKDSKWEALPAGLKSAIKTPLFSLKDKFRILGEPFRSRGKDPHETLAGLVKRRLGKSFLDYAIDPFILGVYAGDPNRLVTKYALPKLYNLEQDYGSFIRGSIKKKSEPKTEEEKKVNRAVFSAKGGLSSIINALYNKIGHQNVQLNASEIEVKAEEGHFLINYTDKEGRQIKVESKKVISTIGAYELEKALPFVDEDDISKINSLHYTKVIEVVLGFDKWVGMKLDAFGGLIPFKEKKNLLGILFMSALLNERAPKEGALFSVFLGGVRNPDVYESDDSEIEAILQKEFCNLMGLNEFKPDLLKIIRHRYAIPQYEADSGDRFDTIEKVEKKFPGLIIGGNMRNGIGMADRILQARMLADEALK